MGIYPSSERFPSKWRFTLEKTETSNTEQNIVKKIALSGSGEGGKSTFIRHLQLIYGDINPHDKKKLRKKMIYNVVHEIKNAYWTISQEDIKRDGEFPKPSLDRVIAFANDDSNFNANIVCLPKKLKGCILDVYDSTLFQNMMESKLSLQEDNYLGYFMEELRNSPEWGGKNWEPSNEDLLKVRDKTFGKDDYIIQADTNYSIALFDIGGQLQERYKHISLFGEIDYFIFVVSLSEYTQTMEEEPADNRFIDSLELWKYTCKNQHIKKLPLAVYFNKRDLLHKKFCELKRSIELPDKYRKELPSPPAPRQDVECQCEKVIGWYTSIYKSIMPENRQTTFTQYSGCALDPKSVESNFVSIVEDIQRIFYDELHQETHDGIEEST